MRTALIGCGTIGQIHAEALASLPSSHFVAVCDVNPERAHILASLHGVTPYTDLKQMIAEQRVEMVSLCTPHHLHATPTITLTQAGIHVLVEKPMALSLQDCDAMIASAHTNQVQLGVISQRRFLLPITRMKNAIDQGKIGIPILAAATMLSWRDACYYQSDPWRGKWESEGGGVLVNQASHQLDLLLFLMGPATEISGFYSNFNHPSIQVEDTAAATIRFQNGALGSLLFSLAQNPPIHTTLHIHGANGASIGTQIEGPPPTHPDSHNEPPIADLWTVPGEEHLLARFKTLDRQSFHTGGIPQFHRMQIEDFLTAITEQRPPLVTGAHGRAVVALFQGIYQASTEHRIVACPS